MLNPLSKDPGSLIRQAAWITRKVPCNLLYRLHAGIIKRKLLSFMPTNLAVTVSDPVSAMVVAALNFLSTPAGQTICGDVRSLIVDLVNHIHGKALADAAPVVAK